MKKLSGMILISGFFIFAVTGCGKNFDSTEKAGAQNSEEAAAMADAKAAIEKAAVDFNSLTAGMPPELTELFSGMGTDGNSPFAGMGNLGNLGNLANLGNLGGGSETNILSGLMDKFSGNLGNLESSFGGLEELGLNSPEITGLMNQVKSMMEQVLGQLQSNPQFSEFAVQQVKTSSKKK